MNKVKKTVRISPYNDEMVSAVASTLFFIENRNEGNYSKGLDWILTNFRLFSKYTSLIKYLIMHDRYLRGSRSREDIEAMKELVTFIESVDKINKIHER